MRIASALALLLVVGCDPVASYCSKQAECNPDKSAETCTNDIGKRRDEAAARPECENAVAKFEAYASCQGGLSCDEFTGKTKSTTCKSQADDWLGAALGNLGCVLGF